MRVLFCLLILLGFGRCHQLNTKEQNDKLVKWFTFVKKGAFVVQYPDYLENDSSLFAEAALACSKQDRQVFFVIISETRDTFRALGYDSMNMDIYMDLLSQNQDTINITEVVSTKKAKVNGLPAIEKIIRSHPRSNREGVMSSQSRQIIIEGKDHFFQIHTWCLETDFERNKPHFDKIIRSFREL